jgi:hypothetical protein
MDRKITTVISVCKSCFAEFGDRESVFKMAVVSKSGRRGTRSLMRALGEISIM